jgi:hypothetical protein
MVESRAVEFYGVGMQVVSKLAVWLKESSTVEFCAAD